MDASPGTKICKTCRLPKAAVDFYVAKRSSGYRSTECKSCRCARVKAWRDARPDHCRESKRRHRAANREQYRARNRKAAGIPAHTRPMPLACEVCGSAPGKKSLSADHDHAAGTFRGWLCGQCNTILGLARDDPARLRALIRYLTGSKSDGG